MPAPRLTTLVFSGANSQYLTFSGRSISGCRSRGLRGQIRAGGWTNRRAVQDEPGIVRNRAMGENLKYKFSGHQTFVFRYGWLEKGVRGVAQCPTLFSEDDALVRLGVGKNMVDSIRHWCQVTQLVETDSEVKGNTGRHLRLTDIGRRVTPIDSDRRRCAPLSSPMNGDRHDDC